MCLVREIFEAIVTSALAIASRLAFALGDDAARFTDARDPIGTSLSIDWRQTCDSSRV